MFIDRYLNFYRILLYWMLFIIIIITFVDGQQNDDDDGGGGGDHQSMQFNVDLKFPITIDPINQYKQQQQQQQQQQQSFDNNYVPFFSSLVAINGHEDQQFILMGSPNFLDSNVQDHLITGAVFSCPVMTNSSNCNRILVNDKVEIFGSNLHYQQTNKSLFGMTIQLTNQTVIICAPNWVGPDDTPEGICFAMDGQEPTKQRVVFKYVRETLVRSNRPYESHNLFGFSIAYNHRDNDLLFGLPGFKDFSGAVCRVSENLTVEKIKLPDYRKTTTNTYSGYSVAYYALDESFDAVLASTPKYLNFKGKIELIDTNSRQVLATFMSKNDTMAEFYGATMLVVDIDGDSQQELLVGAPFYSISSKRREIGRVYLYGNIRQSIIGARRLYSEQIIISPSKVAGSRFGANLAAVDLNLDRFKEVIISAPFEENVDRSSTGAIYIYYSTWRGLDIENFKRIAPENLGQQNQLGFGFNVWTKTDFDSNGYVDLVIGTLQRSFVLRSYPIININASMEFEPRGINFSDIRNCKSRQYPCFLITYCIDLSSNRFQFSQYELTFNIVISVTDRNLDLKEERVLQKRHNQTIHSKSNRYCSNEQPIRIELKNKEDIFDIITPIEVQLSIELQQSKQMEEFCPHCPVANSFHIYQDIGFEHGCVHQFCLSKLMLDANFKYGSIIIKDKIIEGQYNTFDVSALITNLGESSINTQMIIRMNPVLLNLMPSSDFSRCHSIDTENVYRCNVNKLMITKQKEKFVLRFEAQSIQSRYVYWDFELKTSSQIDPGSQLRFQKNITILKEAQFVMRMQMENHYNFSNFVSTNVDGAYVQFEVPWMIEMEQPFQYRCNKIRQGLEKSVRLDLVNGTLKMSCSENPHGCSKYQCKLNRFESGFRMKNFDITLLFISSRIKPSIKYREVILEPSFSLYPNDSIFFLSNEPFDEVKPFFWFNRQNNEENERYQNMIIFGSAGLGIIIIILTTCILIKYGFFKRKKFEELKKERMSMMINPTTMMLPTMDNAGGHQEIHQIGSIS
ncbi:Itga9p [Dermatophagoides farinae]|uniref:Itga9p n=1 Tax=Dermatophagoides farinae TaxID=6954 RepID=A0A922HPS4_DERFA|nr:Itga9p [Dermatophagoides farinae]